MKPIVLMVAAAAALVGCQSGQPPTQPARDKRQTATAATAAGGRFFARDSAGSEHELKLHKLAVDVTTQPGTVHSHLSLEVASAIDGQSEAVLRLPVPRGAAVTDAVLWVNDKPMRGAFVERQRARDIYTSIVTRRRDPALVTWDGPGYVAVSIFPLEKNHPRRFELAWVEPAAVADGRVQYRVPIVAEGDRIVARASMKVDGRRVPGDARDLIALAPADPHKVFTRRAPGDPFQQFMVEEAGPTGAPHFVLIVETSAAMTIGYRERQRAVLDRLLEELSPDAKMTVLAADWDVSPIAEEAGASAWPDALAKIDTIPSAGGLHLERALRDAAGRARKTGAAAVLFVGLGQDDFAGDPVSAPLAELRDARIRLSVVDISGGEVPRQLADATVATGGEAIALRAFEESLSTSTLADALRPRPGHPALDARGDGEWHVLRTVTGGTVWLGRTMNAAPAPDGETTRADAGSPLAADLASLWDRARLEWHDRDARDEIAKVLSPVTSLLVLETEQDYRRFGLTVPEPIAEVQGARGRRHTGEEGKMGSRIGRGSREGLYGLRGPAEGGGAARERLAEEQARNAGILGLLKQSDAQQGSSTFAEDTPPANDASDVLGGLVGNQIGEATGVGELGLIGTGSGGVSTTEGSIGLGNLGTIGKGGADSVNGNGSGYGRGAGGLGGRRVRAPDVVAGVATVRGSLDKEIVRRIIQRHINEVKYCYEQELTKLPGLSGRVMVQFTIADSGQVIASVLQNSTIANSRVESCTVQAVRRWEFPKPLGGGLVIVSYPFLMTPDGIRGAAMARGSATDAVRLSPVVEALARLAKGSGPEQIERISSLLGLRRLSSAEVLAWTIDRRAGLFETRLLVARLLELTKHHRDAVRVLSESGINVPDAVAAELRAIDADADAAEVLRLAKR